MQPALDRAERDGVDHQPDFQPGSDGEHPADLLEHPGANP
jgi:hypothetical protein